LLHWVLLQETNPGRCIRHTAAALRCASSDNAAPPSLISQDANFWHAAAVIFAAAHRTGASAAYVDAALGAREENMMAARCLTLALDFVQVAVTDDAARTDHWREISRNSWLAFPSLLDISSPVARLSVLAQLSVAVALRDVKALALRVEILAAFCEYRDAVRDLDQLLALRGPSPVLLQLREKLVFRAAAAEEEVAKKGDEC
jgi:hypothetical protein